MKHTIKRSLPNYILIAFFVLAYLAFKTIAFTTSSEQPLNIISNLMMFGCSAILIGIWGVNCYRRILYRPIRSYILWSAVSMLLFMFFHTLRRTAVKGLAFYDSFSWYLYYIPMLTIPLLALMASQYLGKPENYTLKPIQYIWMIPAFILLVLVLTNNHHQLIFRLADDWVITGDYSRGLMYYFIPTWIILLILLTFHNIYRSGKPLFAGRVLPLPYILLMIGILYAVLYILIKPFGSFVQLAPAYCIATAVIIDTLMYYGLIPTNSDFEWGFRQSGMNMQILDHEGVIRYSSGSSHILSKEEMGQLINEGTLITENEQELHLQDIPGGYAYYAHDIHDIHSIMKQTSQTNRELIDTNQKLRENIQIAEERWHLEQGNHLFNSCFTDTLPMLSRIDHLLADTDGLSTELLRRRLGLINIYGAYIKRRSNLVILNDQHTEHAGGELVLCLQESIRNLRLYGIQTSFSLKELHHMNIEETILIYAIFICIICVIIALWIQHMFMTQINASSIQVAINNLSDGLCIYGIDGRPLLMNRIIGELSFRLTGSTFVNAAHLYQILSTPQEQEPFRRITFGDGITLILPDEEIWQFTHQTVKKGNTVYYRLIARNLNCRIEITDQNGYNEARLLEDASEAVYTAIREALYNAVRHADATCLYITVNRFDTRPTKYVITDNGTTQSGEIQEGGGLTSIRRELERIGGNLTISNHQGVCLEIIDGRS